MVGLGRLELPTSPLSGVRSNQAELQTHFRGASILQQFKESRKKISYFLIAFTIVIKGPDKI